jgi:GNAT superfamily N-acetyltransferase
MPLDLPAISAQMRHLGETMKASQDDLAERIAAARHVLDSDDLTHEQVAALVETRRTTWQAAEPVEPLATRRRVAPALPDYTVLATDGSYIDADHYRAVMCYVINLGLAVIRYGQTPSADLQSVSLLGYNPEDLFLVHNGRQVAIEGHRLNVKRQVMEVKALADLSRENSAGPNVALVDGTLILSSLESRGGAEGDPFQNEYLEHLDRLREAGSLVASYISRPRSSEVVGALRLGSCPLVECDDACRVNHLGVERDCLRLAGIWDRDVMAALDPGERSGIWRSQWPSSNQYYGEHAVHFFYLHSGQEVVRVEVPEWLARTPAQVDRLHAVLLDQCYRGDGYPRALIEAHEKAVITASDRRAFDSLIDQQLGPLGVSILASAKELSKRRRPL